MYPYPGVKCIRNKSKGETIMNMDSLSLILTVAVAYAISNSSSQTNWIARELFIDVIPEELISEIFDK